MNPALRDRLLRRAPCPLRSGEPLAPLTTFRIGGPAAILAEVRSRDELVELMRLVRDERIPFFYLGLGSNVLVADGGFDGIVVRATGELCRITMSGPAVCAGPGARLLDLTVFAAAHGLQGMERLSGIPGSVGGGLYMNAGAFGAEIADGLKEVEVLTRAGELQTLRRDQVQFAYRSAPELQDKLILESRFALQPGDCRAIYREMRRVWKLRREKQPLEHPSAGSVFKRPAADYAGRLIEAVGGKGARVGGAMVSPKHAGIFINSGTATAEDVAALIREIRRRVRDTFGILLEVEIKPVGFAHDPFAISV